MAFGDPDPLNAVSLVLSQIRKCPLSVHYWYLVARVRPIREANQDARSAPRRGENRLKAIRINRTTDTRIVIILSD